MSWTSERVDRLSRLWLEGLSASQIAADLGEGVSRNAVIGKVHRLGLSGRAAHPGLDTAVLEDESIPSAPPVMASPASALEFVAIDQDEDASEDAQPVCELPSAPRAIEVAVRKARDAGLPQSQRVTILELGAAMCRWPLGDPTSADFRFCGCRATNGLPYCPEHARVAFQPIADRRRIERMVRSA